MARSDYERPAWYQINDMLNADDVERTDDALYKRAVDLVIVRQKASISMVQRSLRIGFSQAAGYFDEMQAMGIISEPDSLGGRTVLVKDEPR